MSLNQFTSTHHFQNEGRLIVLYRKSKKTPKANDSVAKETQGI